MLKHFIFLRLFYKTDILVIKMTLGVCVQKTVLFGIGGVLLIVGVIMASFWPYVFNNVLKSELSLTKGSKTFDMWVETPMPMYIDIYFFNWTNSHDVNAKPDLEQVGPFVFREQRTKVNIGWNNNGTITYQQSRKWIYHPELSNGSLSDNITNLNVIAVTVGSLVRHLNLPTKYLLNALLKMDENLIVTKNVSQLLFEGYSDPVLNIMEILKNNSIKVPDILDKFGWFYKRNMSETADGVFNMYTGVNDINKLGDAFAWNYRNTEPFYTGSCSEVKGSLGELWSPHSAQKESINLYASDICGVIPLASSGILSLYGLSGTIFSGGENVFDNGTLHPENSCYCVNKSDCPAFGLRDVSSCRGGAPVFISFPHFYLADRKYLDAVVGLNPNPQEHSFSITLEEKTGIPMQVKARLQINLLTEKIPKMSFFKVPRTYMPMIWFSQHTEMTEEIARDLRPLSLLASYGVWILGGIATVGFILLLTGLFLKLNNFWGTSTNLSQSETLLVPEN